MLLSAAVAATLGTALGPGHFILHVEQSGVRFVASAQPVEGDYVYNTVEDMVAKRNPLASLVGISRLCHSVPHT